MMDSMNKMSRFCHNPGLGLLLMRVATGLIFIHHGWMKFQSVPNTMKFMGAIGLPEFMAYAIIAVELVGGAMLVLGILGRVAAVATGIAMVVAVALVTYPHKGITGSEIELLLMAVSFGLALTGMGKYRLFHIFEH